MKKWIPVIVISSLLLGGSAYWYYTRPYNASRLMQMLPPDRSIHVFLNLKAMRAGGILDLLAGSATLEEPDYKKFVAETGFDYRTDLDGVAAAFRDGDIFYAAQGRFDWKKLAAYALAHAGKCDAVMCTVAGSVKGRNVSYYMPRGDVLAVATSRASTAMEMVGLSSWSRPPVIPETALWLLAPPYVFTSPESMPAGTRSFLAPLKDATETILTLGSAAGGSKAAFELRMEATFATPAAATAMHKQFVDATDLLVKMLAREKLTPNKNDLSGLLTGGRFQVSGSKVTGIWPVDRSLIESLVTTGINVPVAK